MVSRTGGCCVDFCGLNDDVMIVLVLLLEETNSKKKKAVRVE